MRFLSSFALLATLSLPVAAMADPISYDAVGQFSTASNPNGVWSYGYGTAGGPVTLDPVSGTNYRGATDWSYWAYSTSPDLPVIAHSPSGAVYGSAEPPSNVLEMHPGNFDGGSSILVFTAPTAGSYNFSGYFERVDHGGGTGVDVSIYDGSTALMGPTLIPASAGYGAESAFNSTVTLAAGDTLDFVVAETSTGNYNNDSTGLALTISQTPEPSSMILLGTGLLSVAAAARRRLARA